MTRAPRNANLINLFASLKKRLRRGRPRRPSGSKSGYGQDPDSFRYKVTNWLLTAPRATSILALVAILITALIALIHIRAEGPTLFTAEETEPELVFVYLRGFYYLGLGLLFPVLILCFLRYRVSNLVVPVSIASAAVFFIWAASEIILWQPSSYLYHSGVAPARLPGIFRIVLAAGLILSPPVLVVLYRRAPILDRYLLRQFLGPFLLCSVGILAVWVIYDLQDNGSDFFEARASFGTLLHLYIVQLPQMVVMILPATLLLGLLYSLGKMSKSNEIVSMLSSGRSLLSILSPLLFVGAYTSILCFALNYEWAPQAEAHKDSILDDIEEQRRVNKDRRTRTARSSGRRTSRSRATRSTRTARPTASGASATSPSTCHLRKWQGSRLSNATPRGISPKRSMLRKPHGTIWRSSGSSARARKTRSRSSTTPGRTRMATRPGRSRTSISRSTGTRLPGISSASIWTPTT